MDKQQSSNVAKFKFINGKKWAVASQRHTNVMAGSGNKLVQLIKTDGRFLALPYKSSNGLLAFRKIEKFGKWLEYQDASYVLEAHKAVLSDFDFEPFGLSRNYSRIMTCASDEPMKLWNIDDDEQVSMVQSFQGHSGLFSRLLFHPFVENCIASTHQNKFLYLWDLEKQSIQTTIKEQVGNADTVAWSCESNFLFFCGSSYDRKIRMLDFRTTPPIVQTVDAHSSSKPFQVCSVKNNCLISMGFDKQGQREMLVYDLRSMQQPCHTLGIDRQSSPFCVQYDMDSNVIFAAGRGDTSIKWFTVENRQAIYLNDYQSGSGANQNSVCFVPKLKMDVNACELMRALKLTNENTIETISLVVPRKDNTKQFFAEDIFPPTYDLKPIASAQEFFTSPQQLDPLQFGTVSLKPSDKISVFEVELSLGGKKKSNSNLFASSAPTSVSTPNNEESSSPRSTTVSTPSLVQSQSQEFQQIMVEEEVEVIKLEQVTIQESVQQKKQIKKPVPPVHPIQPTHYSNHYLYLLLLWSHRLGIAAYLFLKLCFVWAPTWLYWKVISKKDSSFFSQEWNKAMQIPPQREIVEETVESVLVDRIVSKPIKTKEKRTKYISTPSSVPSSIPSSTLSSVASTPLSPVSSSLRINEQGLEKGKQMVSQLPLPLDAQWFKRVPDASVAKYIEYDPIDVKQGKQPILVLVKGRRNLRTLQIENKYENLCSNESYVMDCGKVIFQWNGNRANKFKRAKALDLASNIKNKERATEAHIIQMDEGNPPSNPVDKRYFETLFCKNLQMAPESFKKENRSSKEYFNDILQDDDTFYAQLDTQQRLYQINDTIIDSLESNSSSKELQLQLAAEIDLLGKQPSYKMLESEYCYILEIPDSVFVFTGKKSRLVTKKWAIALGRALAQFKTQQFSFVSFYRVIEDAEWNLFKDKFSDYPGSLLIQQQGMKTTVVAVKKEQMDADLHSIKSCRVVIPIQLDDKAKPAVEQITIHRVSNFETVAYPQELYGHFFSKEAYIMLYSYEKTAGSKRLHKIFFWQGADTLRKDKGTSALKTIELSEMISKDNTNSNAATANLFSGSASTAVHVRVVQGKEPKSFLRLFHHKYMIHKGGVEEWLQQKRIPCVKMYQVRGSDHMDHYAMYTEQVHANYLHPYYCNIVVVIKETDPLIYLWKGKYCTAQNEQAAKQSVSLLQELYNTSVNCHEELQGQESSSFSSLIDQFNNAMYRNMPPPHNLIEEQNSMFAVDDTSGQILVRNVCHHLDQSSNHTNSKIIKSTSGKLSKQEEDERSDFYSQEDLESEKVFLIDDVQRARLFVWIGKLANVQVKKYALKTAIDYANLLHYDLEKQCILEKEQEESVDFQSLFHSWSGSSQSVQIRKGKSSSSNSLASQNQQSDSLLQMYQQLTIKEYPYELLKRKDVELPEGVDKSKLESYLSDQEFEQVFGMTREAFSKLPAWKMGNLKKQAELF